MAYYFEPTTYGLENSALGAPSVALSRPALRSLGEAGLSYGHNTVSA